MFNQNSILKMIRIQHDCLIVLDPFWDPFWSHFGRQVGPKSALDRSKTGFKHNFFKKLDFSRNHLKQMVSDDFSAPRGPPK